MILRGCCRFSRAAIAFAAVLLVASGAKAAPASVSQAAEGERSIKRGVALRAQGKDAEALEEFKKAYALSPTPRALAQIGLAEQALGRWIDAERDVDSAMQSSSDPWIKSRGAPLREALDTIREHLGNLHVEGPAGASVEVEGQSVGTLPLAAPVRVIAGEVTVAVSGKDLARIERKVRVPANGAARELFADAAEKPLAANSAGAEANVAPSSAATTVDRASEGGAYDILGLVAAGGAVVATGVGIGALIVRANHVSKYNDDALCTPPNGKTREQNCGSERSAAATAQTFSLIAFAAAGVLAISSVVLFAIAPSDREPAATVGVSSSAHACGLGPGEVGIGCVFRF
jgi:hypothetical protein